MKVLNVLKSGLTVAAVLALVGCASMAGTAAKQVQLSKDGQYDQFGYGLLYITDKKEIKDALCQNLNDQRCALNDKTESPALLSVSFGFADGGRGIWVFMPKSEIENLNLKDAFVENGYKCSTSNTTKCYFGKFKVVPGQLAEFVEVVQKPGEKGPCHWSGLPRAGGTVCESLGFDYRTAKLPTVRNF